MSHAKQHRFLYLRKGKEKKIYIYIYIDKLGRSFNEQVIDSVKSYGDW